MLRNLRAQIGELSSAADGSGTQSAADGSGTQSAAAAAAEIEALSAQAEQIERKTGLRPHDYLEMEELD